MSIHDKLLKLVIHLARETARGKIAWEDTADDETFRVGLANGVVTIEMFRDEDFNGDALFNYRLTVFNERGQVAETFVPATSDGKKLIYELYEAARRSARRTNDVIDALLKETERESE